MMGKGSEETDNKKGGEGKGGRGFSPILIALIIFVIAVGIGLLYIFIQQNCTFLKCFDKDPIRTGLGIAGAVLVVINIGYVIIRIRETQKTTELTDKNLRESQKTNRLANLNLQESQRINYLADLKHGENMLYSDSFAQQRRGVRISP